MGINRIAFLAGQATRIVLIAGFSLSIVASARAFEVTEEQREACTPDAFRLCSSEIPDVSRVAACMAAKKASLSPPCRAVFETASLDRAAQLPHQHRARRALSTYAHYHKSHILRHYAHYREPYVARHRWARS